MIGDRIVRVANRLALELLLKQTEDLTRSLKGANQKISEPRTERKRVDRGSKGVRIGLGYFTFCSVAALCDSFRLRHWSRASRIFLEEADIQA